MTEQDLLTRLRLPQFSAYPAHGTGMVSLVTAQNVADMKEAADEIGRLRAALTAIAAMPNEDNEWDGRDKFREIRAMAQNALRIHQQQGEKT